MPDYPPGTPSWVELSSKHPDASATFYGELMGWSTTEPAQGTGGYRMFQQDGKSVGGLMGHMQEGQPTAWMTYVSVADADATAAKVKGSGGSAIVEPMDVMEPDDRASLLAAVERQLSLEDPGPAQEHAGDALALLTDAAGEVERLLRGPNASSELQIALRALRRTVRHLTNHIRGGEHPASMSMLRRRRLSADSTRARR